MKRILVTTDLSQNAKAALRFALQLAGQYQLTLLHIFSCPKPTSWNEALYKDFEAREHGKKQQDLTQYLDAVVGEMEVLQGNSVKCVVLKGEVPEEAIMSYATEQHFDYICASRSGEGRALNLFGSTASSLVKSSLVPVITVPEHYQATPLHNITYVSDLENLEAELEKVVDFASPLSVPVKLLHFQTPQERLNDNEIFNAVQHRLTSHGIDTQLEPLRYEDTLIKNMDDVFQTDKPSLVVMFTRPRQGLFEKLFLSSISAEYVSVSKVPLLIFRKEI